MWKSVCIDILILKQERECVPGMSGVFVLWDQNAANDMSKEDGYVRGSSLGFVLLGKNVLMLSIPSPLLI
jgi:hypothetical protein